MLCLSLTAFAEPELQTPSDDDISVCYLYTDKISGTLSISNKAATCKSTVRGISGTTTKIVITQTLQKKNGSSWNKYSSWTKNIQQLVCDLFKFQRVFKQRYLSCKDSC